MASQSTWIILKLGQEVQPQPGTMLLVFFTDIFENRQEIEQRCNSKACTEIDTIFLKVNAEFIIVWFINMYWDTLQPLTGLSPMSSSVLSMGSFSRQSRTMSRLMRGSDARSMSSSSSSSSESTAVSGKPLRSMSPGSFSVAWNK